jgi:SAM-dependent methyltransferase
MDNNLLENYFQVLAQEGLVASTLAFRRYLDYLFKDIEFKDKSVLDIGGGSGLFSFYAASREAKEVICLEPESSGSHSGVLEKFEKIQDSLKLDERVKLRTDTFQDFISNQKFDIIILHNSINHLNEGACSTLLINKESVQLYKDIFCKLNRLSNQKAKLIIVDCSRYNLFAFTKTRNPFAPTIEWHKHQSPEIWQRLLACAGFNKPKIRWRSSRLFGKGYFLSNLLLNNKFALYFIDSNFSLIMERTE